ncbi:MAG: UDP-glucose 4-epimerase family protein [Gallionella sp.]
MTNKILVTGANGFVGSALCAALRERGEGARAAVRVACGAEQVAVGEMNTDTDWTQALQGVGTVIHLAARVHVMHDSSANPLDEFRKVNLHGTENLARQAAAAGVKRFVYVSSIKVNGEQTTVKSFLASDTANPQDPYGVSKWEAEQALHRVAQETGLEVVIVRPPLVYGAGVKGNFISLFAAISKGLPLPLAGAHNARSLVYVGNLVDALIICSMHPNAAGKTYLVSDGEDVSTAKLVSEIARSLSCADRSFYFPPAVLRAVASLLGKSAQVDRLFGSLQIDGQKIRTELGWIPPYTLQQGLQATADWYRNTHD